MNKKDFSRRKALIMSSGTCLTALWRKNNNTETHVQCPGQKRSSKMKNNCLVETDTQRRTKSNAKLCQMSIQKSEIGYNGLHLPINPDTHAIHFCRFRKY